MATKTAPRTAGKTRTRKAPAKKKVATANERVAGGEKADAVTLEEFIVACQKSLARSVRSAQQAGKSDSEFAQGERPLYMVDGLEFTLSAGIRVLSGEQESLAERVLLNFDEPVERRSSLKFRVDIHPSELLAGAKLELANMDPLGQELPDARMRIWLVDDNGQPVPNHKVRICFARAGEKRGKDPLVATTDSVGRIDFFVDTRANQVKIVGDRRRHELYLRGGGRGKVPDEYFVWAVADRKPAWKKIVEPAAPHPPRAIRRGEKDEPLELCSELHRLKID